MKIVKLCALIGAVSLLSPAISAQGTQDGASRQSIGLNDAEIKNFTGRVDLEKRVDNIVIKDFTGRVIVEIGGTQTSAILQGSKTTSPVKLSQNGSSLFLAGKPRPRDFDASDKINWRRHGEEAFDIFLADYPTLTITTPTKTALELDDAITIAAIGDLNGDLVIKDGFVDVVAGDMQSAKVSVHGPGDIILGAVQHDLTASVHGSGDISAESAGNTKFSVHGSGDGSVGDINGDAVFNVHGSGNIETGDIDGGISASIHGSGDINTGAVKQAGDMSIHGSGDISLETINGPAKAEIFGSGNIIISSGRAQSLRVSINGSGDFKFGGVSTDLVAYVRGSGGIDIAQNEGTIRTSGRGDIRVGGIQFNDDN